MSNIRPTLILVTFAAVALAAVSAPAATPNGPPTPPAPPIHSFSASLTLANNTDMAVGAGGAGNSLLEVTSITFTNFSTSAQQIYVFDATTDGTSCSAAVTGGSVTPHNNFILPPQQNTHFTFPTPLEIPRLEGVSCLGFDVTTNLNGGSVGILLNGFISGK